MGALLTLSVLVGLDNLQVAAALGLTPMPPGRRLRLALAFGLCEGLMPLVGLLAAGLLQRVSGPWPEWVEAGVLVGCGVALVGLALREPEGVREWADPALRPAQGSTDHGPRRQRGASRAWWPYGLPLSLSFDNLLAGVALGTLGFPLLLSAAVVGATSTALCLVGLFGAARLGRWLPGESSAWSGAFLILLGLLRAWNGAA